VSLSRSGFLCTELTSDTADGAVKASHKDTFANLGEVTIKLTRCRKTGTDKTDHKTSFNSAAEQGIPEKALKGRAIGAHAKSDPYPRLHSRAFNES